MPIVGDFGGISARGYGQQSGSIVYNITPSVSSVNEGSSVTFTVTTPGLSSGTLYWKIVGVSGTINDNDFSSPTTAVSAGGTVTIANSTGSFSVTVRSDATTEGAESFAAQLRTVSQSGTLVKTSSTVTINDTSLSPFFPPLFVFSPPFFPPAFVFSPPFFPPSFCIQGDVLIKTINGYIKARDIKIGDKLISYTYKELPTSEEEYDFMTWTSKKLTEGKVVEAEVYGIKSSIRNVTVAFNSNRERRFSLEHTMFIKRNGTYMFAQAGTLELGDELLYDNNGNTIEVILDAMNFINEETDVYEILINPYDLIIAGDLIVHNTKGGGF